MSFAQLSRVLGRILRYLTPYWKIVVGALLLTVVVTGARLCQAKFVGYIMGLMSNDNTQSFFSYQEGHSPFATLNIICLAFLGIMTLMGIATYFQKYATDQCGWLAIRDYRAEVFAALQRLPASFFDSMRAGEVLSRSTTDIITASNVYITLSDAIKNILTVIACFCWMFYRDWQMTLVVLLVSPVVALAVSNFGKQMGQKTAKLQARLADLSALQYENVAAIKVVKAYTREDIEIDRFNQRNEDNYNAEMKVTQIKSMQSPVVELLGIVGIMTIVWFGATRIMTNQVSFAQMTEYWTLMVMTSQPINMLSTFYSTCQNAAMAGSRAFSIIDAPPETIDDSTMELPLVEGAIAFNQVSFSYKDGKPVLHDLSLSVPPGQVTAIVGTNGAGKSTLVNMVPRFYQPTKGNITVDGIDISTCSLVSLRSQIGMVFQESVLFQGSIIENIRCGKPDASDEEVYQAAKLANADEFIKTFPDGYQTDVGERGSQLSGGQRQRLAIARALIRNPRILILDEYTSGLDSESENSVTEAISSALRGRTCLVIAHRLTTIRHADHIVVMDAGRIVEQGTHAELIARDGLYRTIYEAQFQDHRPE